jgi:hypothetical protein
MTLTSAELDEIIEHCTNPSCSRVGDRCVGYHCAYCGEPCSSMGHDCDARSWAKSRAAAADEAAGPPKRGEKP